MNQGDTVQIEAPDFDPDIDGVSSPSTDEKWNELPIQGTSSPTPEVTEPEDDSLTPAITIQQLTSQDTDWLDAIPVQITIQAQYNSKSFEIPDLEENSEEEQFADLESYLAHHNTYEASQHIHQEYRSHLHALDDDQYYAEIDRVYYSQETLAAQDYQLANQSVEPHRTTEELKRIFGKGRGQEKSCTVIDHLAQELVPCKVTSSARSRRISSYVKGMLITVNILMSQIHNVNVKTCQDCIKVYQPNVLLNNNWQNPGTNPEKETNRPGTG